MNIKKYNNNFYLIIILIILAIIILLICTNYKKTNNSNYNSPILNLLYQIKKKIINGEARDLTAVESAIIHIKTGFSKNANPTTSILFSAIAIRDLGVIASSKSINLNNSDKKIVKNEILKLSSKISERTKEL